MHIYKAVFHVLYRYTARQPKGRRHGELKEGTYSEDTGRSAEANTIHGDLSRHAGRGGTGVSVKYGTDHATT